MDKILLNLSYAIPCVACVLIVPQYIPPDPMPDRIFYFGLGSLAAGFLCFIGWFYLKFIRRKTMEMFKFRWQKTVEKITINSAITGGLSLLLFLVGYNLQWQYHNLLALGRIAWVTLLISFIFLRFLWKNPFPEDPEEEDHLMNISTIFIVVIFYFFFGALF